MAATSLTLRWPLLVENMEFFSDEFFEDDEGGTGDSMSGYADGNGGSSGGGAFGNGNGIGVGFNDGYGSGAGDGGMDDGDGGTSWD